jgi:hypothetical protein
MRDTSIPKRVLYFAAASGASLLSAIVFPYALFVGMAVSGAICGASLAGQNANQYLAKQAAIRFGVGFLIGGCFVEYSYLLLLFFDGNWDIIFEVFCLYVCGFLIAGFLGSILTRSRLLTVYAGIVIFGVAGALGGAILVLSLILSRTYDAIILGVTLGLLASFMSSGALYGIAQFHWTRNTKTNNAGGAEGKSVC